MTRKLGKGAVALMAALTISVPAGLLTGQPAAAYVFNDVRIQGAQRIEPATILSYALNLLGISSWVAEAATLFEGQPVLFLFAIALLMLVLGTFLDIGAAILIFVPILMPAVYELGIDPLQASMVVMLTLAIGLITPPVGVVLFVVMRVGKVQMLPLLKAVMPFLIAEICAVALLCVVPEFSNWLPSLPNPR
mgnify:CR=1 FL=1